YRDERWADDEDELEEEYLFDEEDELETSLEPSASPGVSRYASGERWPQDQSDEGAGEASATQHPASTMGEPPRSDYSAGATGAAAAERGTVEGDAERRDMSGGQDRE